MKAAGIIAEYNPFHTGHKYQIDYIKESLGADYVIVAMSGDFVQRGTPALFSKYVRSEMALRAGADLVLELPTACASASAELFAKGGVQLLNGLGVTDILCFGSECGDTDILMELARLLIDEPEDFQNALRQNLKEGMTFPRARSLALAALLPKHKAEIYQQVLSSPNNILGIEYCKAILRERSSMIPTAIKREGSGYHAHTLSAGSFPSASAIRSAIVQANEGSGSLSASDSSLPLTALTCDFLPAPCQELFYNSVFSNRFLLEKDFDSLYRYCLLQETEESLCTYLDMSQSLARRILACRDRYETFSGFAQLLKTKDITRTRIQRALLHMLLHIHEIPEQIPYARVLGFKRSSSALLGEIKKQGHIPLLTKLANADQVLCGPHSLAALSLLDETTFASNLYESMLAQKSGTSYVHEYKQQIVIL